ncbi:RRXRR domain-containing protein [Methylobacter sp. S3L5C]|uniref:RRXRR domain-containing protein n=1 Tax=Methylobacter sp. S3L5C TaxID=2839024 RepID=UPI001FAE4FDE|nr:RRXRR domain-containing protein [Methylobacter sp. S3L5C]UOA07364.1 RRXRR domain-containing protein [Methylobacter sp. S3L5C]
MSNNTGHRTEKTAGNRRTLTRVAPRLSPLLTVLVVAGDGRPLNPCHPARARELIRKQRAIRICRHPYTIRLLDVSRHEVHAIPTQQEPS